MCESNAVSLWLEDEQQTRRAGGALWRLLVPLVADRSVVIFVRGNLGAGKSTFVRGFLTAAGITGVMPSPTYSLVEPYETDGIRLFHMDAYRLADAVELDYLGLDDMHQPGAVTLIEWPDHLRDALPEPCVTVDLAMAQRPAEPENEPAHDRVVPDLIGRQLDLEFDQAADIRLQDVLAAPAWSEFRQVLT